MKPRPQLKTRSLLRYRFSDDNKLVGTKLCDLALPSGGKQVSKMSFEVFTFILAILISIVLIFLAIWNVRMCVLM